MELLFVLPGEAYLFGTAKSLLLIWNGMA
jgi:hypothetical protein